MLEVLAPVGNIQSLKAAIYAGADAVYLGLDLFNARIKADNFNKDNISHWVDYCHLFGVKAYLTFNTNIKQSEREIFAQYVDISAKANVDAFIVTDLGCLDIFKKYDIPLHASTQIGAHNLAGAKVLESLGFTRAVLARETLSSDIKQIKENTNLEIEYFAHGALCVCFSGSCLLSSMMSGDSGNRGRCNQPCRLKYSSDFSSKESYLLSPKDLCLVDKIGDLAQLGVDSLKIEGRLKQPHYVGEAVSQYRAAVDSYYRGQNAEIDYDSLKTAYNRGNFTLGYNYESSKDIMYDKINGNIGLKVGKVISQAKGRVILSLDRELNNGDGVKIIKGGEEVGGFSISDIKKVGKNYQCLCNNVYPIGSDVHLTYDGGQVAKYNGVQPKLAVNFKFTAKRGEPICLAASYNDVLAQVEGDTPQISKSISANYDSVAKQLLRLGESNFTAKLSLDMDEGLFIPASALNNLRREVLEKLSAEILERYNADRQRIDYKSLLVYKINAEKSVDKESLFVEIDSNEDALSVVQFLSKKVNLVLKFDLNTYDIVSIITKNNLIKKNIEALYLRLPRIAKGNDYKIIAEQLQNMSDTFDGIVADNLYGIYLAKKLNKIAIGGIGLNIYNENYARELSLDYYINSIELTNRELCLGMIYAYGRLPVMTMLHCPIQVNTSCKCDNCKFGGEFKYFDKRGGYLIERTKLAYCQFTMNNQQSVDARSKISMIKRNCYINLRGCDRDKSLAIIDDFDKKCGVSEENTTYGHLFRGVK